jgi:hypothetical protein
MADREHGLMAAESNRDNSAPSGVPIIEPKEEGDPDALQSHFWHIVHSYDEDE